MGKLLDETGVSWLIAKIKSVFLTTEDAEAVQTVSVDSTPTENSTNLITSGGVYNATNGKADKIPLVAHQNSDTTINLPADELHIWPEISSLTLTLVAPSNDGNRHEYMFQFTTGTTVALDFLTINNAPSLVWMGSTTIEANKTYQVSIVNNIGIMGGV